MDRILRALAAAALLTCGLFAPLALGIRAAAFLAPGAYLALTALTGTCGGYTLLGISTCPAESRQ